MEYKLLILVSLLLSACATEQGKNLYRAGGTITISSPRPCSVYSDYWQTYMHNLNCFEKASRTKEE